MDIKVGTIRFGEAGTILVNEDEIKHFEQSPYSSEVTFAGSDRLGGYTYTRIKTHAHVYDQQVVNDSYKVSDATCTEPAKYYDSCVCGAKGTHTFAKRAGRRPPADAHGKGGRNLHRGRQRSVLYPCEIAIDIFQMKMHK